MPASEANILEILARFATRKSFAPSRSCRISAEASPTNDDTREYKDRDRTGALRGFYVEFIIVGRLPFRTCIGVGAHPESDR